MTLAQAMVLMLALMSSFYPSAGAQTPEKRRSTGNICFVDSDCPDNAFCKSNSYCVCKDSFIYAEHENEKSCLKVAEYGDFCLEPIQCHTSLGVHSECYINRCSCKNGSHYDKVMTRCYKTSLIGERCVTDHNCYTDDVADEDARGFCLRGYCQCQLQYSPRNNTRCVRDSRLGEACEDELQCAGVGMECKGGICLCKQGFIGQNESNVCLESVHKLGDSCEFDIQCESLAGQRGVGATMCLNGACSCAYNVRKAGEPPRCWVIRRPGQQCRADEECLSEIDEPGYCHHGRCTCAGCVPDARDFADHALSLAPLPVLAAILTTAAILA